MRALPRGNDRSGEFVVEQRSQTTRSLATIYVASTGIKKNHMRALPRGNNRSGKAALKGRFVGGIGKNKPGFIEETVEFRVSWLGT